MEKSDQTLGINMPKNLENQKDTDPFSVLKKGLKDLNIQPSPLMISQFRTYMQKIIDLPHNLTAIRTPLEIIKNHFLDAVSLLSVFEIKEESMICDWGTGAGIPLVPLKIIRSDLKCLFVDSKRKSTDFILSMISSLDLKNCTVLHSHTTQINKKTFPHTDYFISRAFGPLKKILEETRPFMNEKTPLLLYKGPSCQEEIRSLSETLAGSFHFHVIPVKVPYLDKKRNFLECRLA